MFKPTTQLKPNFAEMSLPLYHTVDHLMSQSAQSNLWLMAPQIHQIPVYDRVLLDHDINQHHELTAPIS